MNGFEGRGSKEGNKYLSVRVGGFGFFFVFCDFFRNNVECILYNYFYFGVFYVDNIFKVSK